MTILAAVAGIALLFVILVDAFEAIILPRRVTRKFRLTRLFYASTWALASGIGRRLGSPKRRERVLSVFGPLSMLLLMSVWAIGLILAFALLQWSAGSGLNAPERKPTFGTDLYMSGTTFSTLGLGDVAPRTRFARFLAVAEAGTGFGFLALVIGYLPVLYQAFSRREVNISLLDARAGSPSSASELLRRFASHSDRDALRRLFAEWERWSAELLESHISYPVLCYFRSQHDNESWLAALCTILDTCALVIAGIDGLARDQAELTFAMSRHALVDLAQILNTAPRAPDAERLPQTDLEKLRGIVQAAGLQPASDAAADQKLRNLRRMYEPYVQGLAGRLLLPVPAWIRPKRVPDNWQTSAWEKTLAGLEAPEEEEH